MAVQFSEAALEEYERILGRYPTRRAAIMPVLWLAQREFGWLSTEVQDYVAGLLDLPLAWITGVATFYTQYYKEPPPRYHLQVCTNLSCMLRGSDDVLGTIEEQLGIRPGEKTADGRFGCDEVECLGSCGTAPMLQVSNETYYENLDRTKVLELIERLSRE